MNDRLGSDTCDAGGDIVAASLTIKHQPSTLSFSHDFENRFMSVTLATPETPGGGGSVVDLLYDGDGNRIEKTVTDAFGTRTTRYLVDERNPTGYSQVLAELDASNNVLVAYTVGLDVISQTQVMPTNEVTHFYGYDGHGNVRFLTDAADGGTGTGGYITDRWDYDAFGNIIARSGSTANNLLCCGEYRDPDLGLYFLRARYMDTDRGRFWTMDAYEGTLGMPLSLHKYLYARGDPVALVDPSGNGPLLQFIFGATVRAFLARAIVGVAVGAVWSTTEPGMQKWAELALWTARRNLALIGIQGFGFVNVDNALMHCYGSALLASWGPDKWALDAMQSCEKGADEPTKMDRISNATGNTFGSVGGDIVDFLKSAQLAWLNDAGICCIYGPYPQPDVLDRLNE